MPGPQPCSSARASNYEHARSPASPALLAAPRAGRALRVRTRRRACLLLPAATASSCPLLLPLATRLLLLMLTDDSNCSY